jgi:hypothetical protein
MSNEAKEHDTHFLQTEYYCKDCDAKHFGNCPKVKVVMTTTQENDELEQPAKSVTNTPKQPAKNVSLLKRSDVIKPLEGLDVQAT